MYIKTHMLLFFSFDLYIKQTKQELDAFFTILRDFEVMEGETAEEMATDVNFTPVQGVLTRWHPMSYLSSNSDDRNTAEGSNGGGMIPNETTFSVLLDLSHYKVGDIIAIYSLARTDQGWILSNNNNNNNNNFDNGSGGKKEVLPAQSNIVNARTNPNNGGSSGSSTSSIQGRLDWFSVPVTIEIGECYMPIHIVWGIICVLSHAHLSMF